jgi:hypothetical protein
MKKITLLFFGIFCMLSVANAQTSVIIENADFGLPADGVKYTTINSLPGWRSDDLVDNDNGRESNYTAYMRNTGGSIYNVLTEVIPATSTTYKLTFDGWVTYNPEAPSEVNFVVTFSSLVGADPTARVAIKTVTIIVGTDPNSAEVTIPAAAAYAGANLVIEVDCSTPSLTNTNTWVGVDNFVLTRTDASLATNSNQFSDNSIKVYPNPFTSEFKVDATDSEGPLQVSVFDVLGRKVATAKSSSNQLSMGSSLKSGVYVVKVEDANAKDSKSFKIIKK